MQSARHLCRAEQHTPIAGRRFCATERDVSCAIRACKQKKLMRRCDVLSWLPHGVT